MVVVKMIGESAVVDGSNLFGAMKAASRLISMIIKGQSGYNIFSYFLIGDLFISGR